MPSAFRTLQPVFAALLAACVLLLGFAAHSPALHAELCTDLSVPHDHAESPADTCHEPLAPASDHADPLPGVDKPSAHACAITLFAAGCYSPSSPVLLLEPALNAARVSHFTEFMLARTLRGPARVCGPPAYA